MAKKSNASDRELRPRELKALASELEVNNPIMSYKVTGSTIELRLLGGAIVQGAISNEDLSALSLKELRSLSAGLGISGRSKMKREELEEAILSYG
jgi:hypothetical protein